MKQYSSKVNSREGEAKNREQLWDRLTAEERLLPKYKILRKMMKDHERRSKKE